MVPLVVKVLLALRLFFLVGLNHLLLLFLFDFDLLNFVLDHCVQSQVAHFVLWH